MSAELVTVNTLSAGQISLSVEWSVVFKDEETEKSLVSPDLTLNVQQVLYARAEDASAEKGAALQIFSIWGSDGDGNESPVPEGMLDTHKELVTGLIGGRYGNVSELGEETVETPLKNITVTTYGVTFSLEEGPELRYKCAFLYRGGKHILALLSYGAEFEEHWRTQLASLLNVWVESLTFTPAPTPVAAPALEASLPALPAIPTLPISSVTAQADSENFSGPASPEITPPARQEPQKTAGQPPLTPSARETGNSPFSRIPIGQLSLLWGTFFFVLYVLRKRDAKKRLQAESETPESAPAVIGPKPGVKLYPQSRALPTLEEWLAEKPVFEREEYVPPASSDGGFDRVYNLFDQALNIMEDAKPEPAEKPGPSPAEFKDRVGGGD